MDLEDTHCVSATFSYLKTSPCWKSVRPYFIHIPRHALPAGLETTNEESIPVSDVPVRDMRTNTATLSLDKNGFEVIEQNLMQYVDEYVYKGQFSSSAYTAALGEMLRKRLGAEKVIKLSGTIRERDPEFPRRTWGTKNAQQPIQGVHVGKYLLGHSRHVSNVYFQVGF